MKPLLTIFILLLAVITLPAQITSGLMAYYPCNGNFNDVSGNNNHGTVNGAVPATGKDGNPSGAYLFDGVDDYVSVPALGVYTSFTLMTRVKFTSTALMNVFSGHSAVTYASVSLGKVRWYDLVDWRWSTSFINNGQWHDIAYIFDNGTYSIYVDGSIEYTGVGNTNYPTGLINLIGAANGDRFFNGSLDDIRIYNRALTASEVNIALNGYPVTWTELTNLTVNPDNSLIKNPGPSGYDAGAVSHNILPAGQDGFIEFIRPASGHFGVYLTTFNNYIGVGGTYGMFAQNGVIYIQGVTGNSGPFANGDVLRISREGSLIKYFKNGALLHQGTARTDIALRVDVTSSFGTIPPIFASFDKAIILQPDFTFPGLAGNDGAITINPEGGDAPYTYAWSSGETTQTITNKSRGAYSVTVTDAAGRTASQTYNLQYAASWTNIKDLTQNANGTFTKSTSGTAWDAGMSSLNMIPPNTDGWFEFVWGVEGTYVADLRIYDLGVSFSYPTRAVYLDATNGRLDIYEATTLNLYEYPVKGDIIRIAREGANVKYYRNGIVFRTGTLAAASPLILDVVVSKGSAPVIVSSIDKQIRITPFFTYPNGANEGGAITTSIEGAHTPFTVSWSSGEQTQGISGKPRGAYTINVTDAGNRTVSKTYELGYPVEWTDLQYTAVNPDNSISRIAGSSVDWGASAVSSNTLEPNTDGWMEFVVGDANGVYMMGLSVLNSVPEASSIAYAVYFSGGVVRIIEYGVDVNTVIYAIEGDILKIAREGSLIKYYLNGTLIRSRATSTSLSLVVDCSVSRISLGPLPVVTTSFGDQPQTFYAIASGNWTNINTWSLSEGGVAASTYPGPSDVANIKGYGVTINSGVNSGDVNITVTNADTSLKIEGAAAQLKVTGEVTIRGQNNTSTVNALVVQNEGKINVLAVD